MRVFERRAGLRVQGHRRFGGAHHLHVLHVEVRLESVIRVCVRAPGGLASSRAHDGVRLEGVFCVCVRAPGGPLSSRASASRRGASSSRPSRWGSPRERLSCACSSAGRAYEFKGIGVSEGRIVFTSFTLGFASRASFVRVFEHGALAYDLFRIQRDWNTAGKQN